MNVELRVAAGKPLTDRVKSKSSSVLEGQGNFKRTGPIKCYAKRKAGIQMKKRF
jgi:hypothetical protein